MKQVTKIDPNPGNTKAYKTLNKAQDGTYINKEVPRYVKMNQGDQVYFQLNVYKSSSGGGFSGGPVNVNELYWDQGDAFSGSNFRVNIPNTQRESFSNGIKFSIQQDVSWDMDDPITIEIQPNGEGKWYRLGTWKILKEYSPCRNSMYAGKGLLHMNVIGPDKDIYQMDELDKFTQSAHEFCMNRTIQYTLQSGSTDWISLTLPGLRSEQIGNVSNLGKGNIYPLRKVIYFFDYELRY